MSPALMPELSLTTAEFRGVPLGRGSDWPIRKDGLQGWAQTPETSKAQQQQPGAYGWQQSAVEAGGRTVMLAGVTDPRADRDVLVEQFTAAFGLNRDPWQQEWLTVTAGGRQLSAFGQLTDSSIGVAREGWGVGAMSWSLVFQCEDGRLYGPERTVSAPMVTRGTGIAPPLTPPVTIPDNPIGSAMVCNNPGNAPGHATYQIKGGTVQGAGWLNSLTGLWVAYPQILVAGQVLTLDTRAGAGLTDGAYRLPQIGSAAQSEFLIEPGANGIQPIGTVIDGDPIGVVTYRPAYWL